MKRIKWMISAIATTAIIKSASWRRCCLRRLLDETNIALPCFGVSRYRAECVKVCLGRGPLCSRTACAFVGLSLVSLFFDNGASVRYTGSPEATPICLRLVWAFSSVWYRFLVTYSGSRSLMGSCEMWRRWNLAGCGEDSSPCVGINILFWFWSSMMPFSSLPTTCMRSL